MDTHDSDCTDLPVYCDEFRDGFDYTNLADDPTMPVSDVYCGPSTPE